LNFQRDSYVFGSQTAKKVLLFLANYQEGYAQEIADLYDIPINMVQNQLKKFEEDREEQINLYD